MAHMFLNVLTLRIIFCNIKEIACSIEFLQYPARLNLVISNHMAMTNNWH